MSQEQFILDDENLFEKEEFLRLVPTLKKTVFWNRAVSIILVILTLFLFIGWGFMLMSVLGIYDPIILFFFIGLSILMIATGWFAFRLFRVGQSTQRYINSHQEVDLENSLAQQALNWRSFGLVISLWALVGIGGVCFIILISGNNAALEEAPMVQDAVPIGMDTILPSTTKNNFDSIPSPE